MTFLPDLDCPPVVRLGRGNAVHGFVSVMGAVTIWMQGWWIHTTVVAASAS